MGSVRMTCVGAVAISVVACGSGSGGLAGVPAAPAAQRCAQLAQLDLAGLAAASAKSRDAFPANAQIKSAVLQPATDALPAHCQIDARINSRTGVDGQPYAINFRLRLPEAWNKRFFMSGGGGTNGTLIDPVAQLKLGYATIGTDSGHDNTVDNKPSAGGSASFGVDPQARIDFAYNAYDQVTRAGKVLTQSYYGQGPSYAYFQGCSEGGREALLMSQRFPMHYDGIIAGDPTLHLPLGPLSGIYTTQLFAGLATRAGKTLPSGQPAIGLSFSEPDLLLVRNAVLKACDSLDGLADGIVDNLPACTTPRVHAELQAVQCTSGKTSSCLTADQIATLEKAYAGAVDSSGRQLYSDWPWDPGMSGLSSATNSYNLSWRSWWLGSASATTNNAIKLSFVSAIAVLYTSWPILPFTSADTLPFSLAYDFDTDVAKIYNTSPAGASPAYAQSAASMYFTDATDLSGFSQRSGKLMIYQGGADSSVSVNDTLRWYDAMNRQMGGSAQDFARMYVVPGMNHCSGGPSTDSFDMLAQLVQWVEAGTAPDRVVATASNPGYFNVAARSRPLCPYPQQARYNGAGDINVAANFRCQ
jgi:hypothetical protein